MTRMPENRPVDAQDLIEGHFLGSLTDEQSAELEAMLLDNRSLRDDFRQAAALDTALRDEAVAQAAETEIAPLRLPHPRKRYRVLVRAAAAALVLLTASATWFGIHRLRYPTVARLTNIAGDVTVRSGTRLFKARNGRRLWSGVEVEAQGRSSVIIAWKDGSTMRLDENSRLNIDVVEGQKRLSLIAGMMDCDVKKQPDGKPLIVSAPRTRLEILGTRFRAGVVGDGSFTEVSGGKVRVERVADGKTVTLEERQKVLADGSYGFAIERFYWSDRFRGGGGVSSGKCEVSRVGLPVSGNENK